VDGEVELWVDEFLRQLDDERRVVDVESFVERVPQALRAEVRERCREVAFLRELLRGAAGDE
jgi:hypothetical protein